MAYDLHGHWETNVDLHSKLHPTKGETTNIGTSNTAYAANYWANKGVPKRKIIIGISTYGRGWTLADPKKNAIGSAALSKSSPSTIFPDGGKAAYLEICKYLKEGGRETVEKDGIGAVLIKGKQWFGYDNEKTIKSKMEWLKREGFGGAFIWSLDSDDFTGKSCGKGQYPLTSAVWKELTNNKKSSNFLV
ncbi:unnamed protein product [Thelazia callipaeda]|uniref:Glyco_hydro_18 domain-containing protein n=1 Tax=Thelazia callipaeda TaxID=103827 RepID=A0A0N5CTB5_THECL|nr:unnamed protein product [Thelazia callipaeda]